MLIVSVTPKGGPSQVLGVLGCARLQPVASYAWLRPVGEDYCFEVVLKGYSRWSEPAAGLLARLLARRPASAARLPLVQALRCQLLIGRHVSTARPVEQLDVSLANGKLRTLHRDELSAHRKTAAARAEYASLDDLVVHAARVSVWGSDAEPPIPPALTAVPVREVNGVQVVFEADIPDHARRHFARRRDGCSVPIPGAYYAHDWLHFIGA